MPRKNAIVERQMELFSVAKACTGERNRGGKPITAAKANSANKSVKSFATLTRTSSTARLFAHGFAIIAPTALRTGRRLPRR